MLFGYALVHTYNTVSISIYRTLRSAGRLAVGREPDRPGRFVNTTAGAGDPLNDLNARLQGILVEPIRNLEKNRAFRPFSFNEKALLPQPKKPYSHFYVTNDVANSAALWYLHNSLNRSPDSNLPPPPTKAPWKIQKKSPGKLSGSLPLSILQGAFSQTG